MPDTLAGLPLHPLLVHATVVIVPAAAFAVLLAALWPRFRRWAGPLPLGLALAGLVLDPLSTSTGESLEHQVGESALVEKHAALAEGLLPWMALLVLAAAALFAWSWRQARREPAEPTPAHRWLPVAISVLAVVAAAGTTVQVALIGHSGAKSAWSDVATQSANQSANQSATSSDADH